MGKPSVHPMGTIIYKPEKCFNGYTLFQANEHGATLIDMNGGVVNHWQNLEGFPNKLLKGGYVKAAMFLAVVENVTILMVGKIIRIWFKLIGKGKLFGNLTKTNMLKILGMKRSGWHVSITIISVKEILWVIMCQIWMLKLMVVTP